MFECKVCKEREQRIVELKIAHATTADALEQHIESLREEVQGLKILLGTMQHNTLPTVNIDTRDDTSAVNPPEGDLNDPAYVDPASMLRGDY